jgi:hypothetical protein
VKNFRISLRVRGIGSCPASSRWTPAPGLGGGHDGQERVGEHRQDGPPHPGGPGPDLVLVQGSEFLAAGEALLRPSAGSRRPRGARAGAPGRVRGRGGTRTPVLAPGAVRAGRRISSQFAPRPSSGRPGPVVSVKAQS